MGRLPRSPAGIAIVLALAATAVLALWLQLEIGGAVVTLWVDDLATLAAALTATVLCALAARRDAGELRRFWSLLAAAAGAWALAELLWAIYDLLVGDVPTVSWADVGYLSAIPLAVLALLVHPALRGHGVRNVRSLIDGLAIATALLFLSWTFVLGPLWDHADATTVEGLVALSYPFGDVVLIFFVVLAARRMEAADRLPLWCLLGGLLAMALSDSVYAYLTGVEDFAAGGVLDAGWFAGYLGIALAALSGALRPRPPAVAPAAAPPLAPDLVPFLPLLLALGVLGIEMQIGRRPDRVGLATAFALVALVLARQGLQMIDAARRPAGRREGAAR